jgi:hypothetical protein
MPFCAISACGRQGNQDERNTKDSEHENFSIRSLILLHIGYFCLFHLYLHLTDLPSYWLLPRERLLCIYSILDSSFGLWTLYYFHVDGPLNSIQRF